MYRKNLQSWIYAAVIVLFVIRSIFGLHEARTNPNSNEHITAVLGRYSYAPLAMESIYIFVALSVSYVLLYGRFRMKERGLFMNVALVLTMFDLWALLVVGIAHYAERDPLYYMEITLVVCAVPLLIFAISAFFLKKYKLYTRRSRQKSRNN